MTEIFADAYAHACDAVDPLRHFREEFHLPLHAGGTQAYFVGNSLGLQPKAAATYVKEELDDWATFGVEGHFKAKRPWYPVLPQAPHPTAR